MTLDTTMGGANADSYGELADWEAYAASMGQALTGEDSAKETALRRAAAFLDREYSWLGYKASQTQSLAWPRVVSETGPDGYSVASDSVPAAIITAQFEIAFLINSGNDLMSFNSGAAIKRKKIKSGPIETDTEYADSSGGEARIRAVEGLLRGYVQGAQPGQESGSVRFMRG